MARVLTASLSILALGSVALLGAAQTARAAGASADTVIEQAAQAADLCATKLTAEDELKVAARAIKAYPDRTVGGRLNMLYDAREPTRVKRYSLGCKNKDVAELVDLYKNAK
jgi:hypothetical protein